MRRFVEGVDRGQTKRRHMQRSKLQLLNYFVGDRQERRRHGEAEQAAPDHSITASARASTASGTSMPSALAVFRLITSSYLVGACTGRSAGFSPLRMRST